MAGKEKRLQQGSSSGMVTDSGDVPKLFRIRLLQSSRFLSQDWNLPSQACQSAMGNSTLQMVTEILFYMLQKLIVHGPLENEVQDSAPKTATYS